MEKFVVWITTTIIGFGTRCVNAFMLVPMWSWVITPVFGIVAPTYWMMVALTYIVSVVTIKVTLKDVREASDVTGQELFVASMMAALTHIMITASSFAIIWMITK